MMKQLWRKWYLWAAMIILPVVPVIGVYYILTYPVFNDQYAHDIFNYAQQQIEQMGPSIDDEFHSYARDKYTYDYHGGSWRNSCLQYPQFSKVKATAKERQYIYSIEGQDLSKLENITSKGIYQYRQNNFSSQINSIARLSHRINLSKANESQSNNDVSAALESINQSEVISRSNKTTLIGILIGLAIRTNSCTTASTILDRELTKRQLIEFNYFLHEYKKDSPIITHQVLLREFSHINFYSTDSEMTFSEKIQSAPYILGSALTQLARLDNVIQNPGNLSFLQRYKGRHSNNLVYSVPVTRKIYLTKKLQHLARTEPEIMKYSLVPSEVSPNTPPQDRIIVDFSVGSYTNPGELSNRVRTPLTKTELLLAASAARIYYQENGQWPQKLSDLQSDYYTPLTEKANNRLSLERHYPIIATLNENIPFGPILSGNIVVDNQTLLPILHHYLPSLNTYTSRGSYSHSLQTRNNFVNDHCSPQWNETHGEKKKVHLTIPWKFLQTPSTKFDLLQLLYQKQLINEGNFQYAKQAEVKLKIHPETEFRIYTDEELQQLGNKNKHLEISRMANIPEGYKKLFGPVPDQLKPIRFEALLELTLELPKELYAIWSTGPDGKNQQGKIQYSPSYGSYSTGDIIIFPGGL